MTGCHWGCGIDQSRIPRRLLVTGKLACSMWYGENAGHQKNVSQQRAPSVQLGWQGFCVGDELIGL